MTNFLFNQTIYWKKNWVWTDKTPHSGLESFTSHANSALVIISWIATLELQSRSSYQLIIASPSCIIHYIILLQKSIEVSLFSKICCWIHWIHLIQWISITQTEIKRHVTIPVKGKKLAGSTMCFHTCTIQFHCWWFFITSHLQYLPPVQF